MKNWRPISLLSVIYKIISSAIANRIKTVLDKLVSETQAGFVARRFIGENSRLIYDILRYTWNIQSEGLGIRAADTPIPSERISNETLDLLSAASEKLTNDTTLGQQTSKKRKTMINLS